MKLKQLIDLNLQDCHAPSRFPIVGDVQDAFHEIFYADENFMMFEMLKKIFLVFVVVYSTQTQTVSSCCSLRVDCPGHGLEWRDRNHVLQWFRIGIAQE